jgi:hypothetical protein
MSGVFVGFVVGMDWGWIGVDWIVVWMIRGGVGVATGWIVVRTIRGGDNSRVVRTIGWGGMRK